MALPRDSHGIRNFPITPVECSECQDTVVGYYELSWQVHGTFMGLPWDTELWGCYGAVMRLPWDFHGTAMRLPWDFHGTAMGLPWDFHGTSMGLPWDCHGTAMGLPWWRGHGGVAMRMPRAYRHVSLMGLLWECTGRDMSMPWEGFDNPNRMAIIWP